jgi:ubiquinone/menaquinone biosynthesis C-methylase UbiE
MAGIPGKHLPAFSSVLRPPPLVELRHWGGEGLLRGKRVLDLGCGDGRFALSIAPLAAAVDGLDPDAEAIAAAREGARSAGVGNLRFAVGTAERMTYPDSAFEVVLLTWSL